jgi:hypothetical protein
MRIRTGDPVCAYVQGVLYAHTYRGSCMRIRTGGPVCAYVQEILYAHPVCAYTILRIHCMRQRRARVGPGCDCVLSARRGPACVPPRLGQTRTPSGGAAARTAAGLGQTRLRWPGGPGRPGAAHWQAGSLRVDRVLGVLSVVPATRRLVTSVVSRCSDSGGRPREAGSLRA